VFGLPSWAGDRQAPHVDVKVLLGEEFRIRVAGNPWLAQHLTTARQHQWHRTGIDVASIDVEFADLQALAPDILLEFWRGFFLGAVGGRDRAREDEPRIKIGSEVPLVTVEALALTFAPVAHLWIFDRNDSFGRDAVANS